MTQNNTPPEQQEHVCSVCGQDYIGWGNNAWPINDGRCCDPCNQIVIMHRLADLQRQPLRK